MQVVPHKQILVRAARLTEVQFPFPGRNKRKKKKKKNIFALILFLKNYFCILKFSCVGFGSECLGATWRPEFLATSISVECGAKEALAEEVERGWGGGGVSVRANVCKRLNLDTRARE
jgi:hypothetical protein